MSSKSLKWQSDTLLVALALATLLNVIWFTFQQSGRQAWWDHSLILGVSACTFLGLALVALNIELSRRTQAGRTVVEERKFLESILNSCSDAVVVADGHGKIILRNPAANSRLPDLPEHTPPQELPKLLGFYRPDGISLYRFEDLALPRTLRGEIVNGVEICVRPPDGSEPRWLLEAGSPLLNDAGERIGGVVFLRDITDRKAADEQLKAALLESESHAQESTRLTKLVDLLQSCHTIEEACKISEGTLPLILGLHPGALFLMNSSRNLLETCAVWNSCSSTEQVFNPDDCWALRLGKPYGGGEPGSSMRCAHITANLTGNYLCLPLVAQGETLGVLYLEENPAISASSAPLSVTVGQHEKLNRRAVAVAERLSLALSNLKLREVLRSQSIRDPLTGLFNRRYLEESLAREVQRAVRKKSIFCVVMLDLDHYKRFNDTFGHQAGDLLLREIAGALKTRVRAGDLACRYGGEEFAVVLSDVGASGANVCIEAIRDEIKHLPIHYRGQVLSSVTISAGIAEFPTHGETPEDLIRAADAALYRAKRAGRDRVLTAANEVENPTTTI